VVVVVVDVVDGTKKLEKQDSLKFFLKQNLLDPPIVGHFEFVPKKFS
jgi:hypothetical protein